MYTNYQNAYLQPVSSAAQSVFQPGFAGTNPQQVRQDIAREGGFGPSFGSLQQQAGLGGFGQQVPMSSAGMGMGMGMGNVQAIFQPGFAGTNAQAVRQDIAREIGFGPSAYGYPQAAQANVSGYGGAQAIFQPGFAGTNPQQVRQDISREGGFGPSAYGYPQAAQANVSGYGGAQVIFQPGFAGTNPQQVRQDISREGGFGPSAYGYPQAAQANVSGFGGAQANPGGFGGAQAIFQPGFAGTNAQQVHQDIAREGGFSYGPYGF